MEITDFRRMATGVGGSYTRWQSKPPAHAVFWIETDAGQTTVKAYDLTDRVARDDDVLIEDGAMGPGDRPFRSEVDFSKLPEEHQAAIRERIIDDFTDEDD